MHELLLRLAGYPVTAARRKWQQLSALEGGALRAYQEQQAWEMARYHYRHTPAYRQKIGNKWPACWEDLPVVQKTDLQRPLKELISTDYRKRSLYVSNTSGSSGHPFFFAKDKFCHALTWLQIQDLYRRHGITPLSRQARFYGMPLKGRSHWTERAKDWLSRRRRFPVFDLSEAVLERWMATFRRRSFDYLYGYTSALSYFARFCRDQGVLLRDICPTLKVCMVTSEVCTPEDREILEAGFGLPVVNEYGASETGLIAFEHPGGQWRLCEELLYIEVVDGQGRPVPEGQAGRILLTCLYNKAMPFIRYEVGDIGAVVTDDGGHRVLSRLEGRVNDFVQLPSGRQSPGLTFYYISREILERSGFIREFIIVQPAVDRLKFIVKADRPLSSREQTMIRENMNLYLEPGLHLEIEQVDQIERPASGKIKHFYSEL